MQRWLARAIYYPTLAYNVFLGRVLRRRHWWDPIGEHLILGARPLGQDPHRLHQLGVTGVVNMCEEFAGPETQYRELSIEQLWLPTVDFNHPSEEHVQAGAEFIHRHELKGGTTYVHCKAGRARSATVVLWWLIRFHGLTPKAAQEVILQARPHANPLIYQRPVIQSLLRKHSGETATIS